MAKADGIEADDRSARGEVHVTLGNVTICFQVVHRNLVTFDVALGFGILGGDTDSAGEGTLAGEASVGIQPVHFDEDIKCKIIFLLF